MNLYFSVSMLVVMLILLSFSIIRWFKFAIYSVTGIRVDGQIEKQEKSRFRIDKKKGIYYYKIHYIYYDKENKERKGKMHKLYHSDTFKVGESVSIIYLPRNPDKSIVPNWAEFFYYELSGTLLVIFLYMYVNF